MRVKVPAKKAQQARSRRTEDLLLAACGRVLARDGLDACTIPRVAEEAKLAPATVYRRFADKDALLRAAFLHALQASYRNQREGMEKAIQRSTLAETAERAVATLLQQFRTQPKLMRGVAHFMNAKAKGDFAQETNKLMAAHLKLLAALLLRHRERIRHEDPERAAMFAVLTAASALEVMALEPHSMWTTGLPMSDKALVAEHARWMVAYLRRKP